MPAFTPEVAFLAWMYAEMSLLLVTLPLVMQVKCGGLSLGGDTNACDTSVGGGCTMVCKEPTCRPPSHLCSSPATCSRYKDVDVLLMPC